LIIAWLLRRQVKPAAGRLDLLKTLEAPATFSTMGHWETAQAEVGTSGDFGFGKLTLSEEAASFEPAFFNVFGS